MNLFPLKGLYAVKFRPFFRFCNAVQVLIGQAFLKLIFCGDPSKSNRELLLLGGIDRATEIKDIDHEILPLTAIIAHTFAKIGQKKRHRRFCVAYKC